MWRCVFVAAGAFAALAFAGFTRNWLYVEVPFWPLSIWITTWVIAAWGWRLERVLGAVGIALMVDGLLLFFVMPKIINNGSGQDAVDLFATIGGAGTTLVGLFLFLAGLCVLGARAPKRA